MTAPLIGDAAAWAEGNAEVVALELAFGTSPAAIATTLGTLPGNLIAQLRATGHHDLANAYRTEFDLINDASDNLNIVRGTE